MRWSLVAVLASISCLVSVAPSFAQSGNCSDGIVYDDGVFESAVKIGGAQYRANMVMLFDPGTYPARLDRACISWRRRNTDGDAAIHFDLRVWDTDGPNGGPGTLLGSVTSLSASNVPDIDRWYSFDTSGSEIVIDGPVYIGPSWYPGDDQDIFLSTDLSATPGRQRGFYGIEEVVGAAPATEAGQVGKLPDYRAFGIRANFSPDPCVQDADTICLNNDRHKVEMAFYSPGETVAKPAFRRAFDSVSSGILHFGNPENSEVLIKVLNGCGINNMWWVFSAAATNVQYTITVTDTETGAVKKYNNRPDHPATTVTDTAAFACP